MKAHLYLETVSTLVPETPDVFFYCVLQTGFWMQKI